MKLREHVVLGGAAAAGLTPVLGAQDSLVFLGATVLIDVDHYWDYLVRNDFRNHLRNDHPEARNRREVPGPGRFGKHHPRPRLDGDLPPAGRRVGGIERQVGPARSQDGQGAHHP